MLFRWCDGSLCTVEQVFGENDRRFCWGGVDLLQVEEEERCLLIGKGTYEHWLEVWGGRMEKEEEE